MWYMTFLFFSNKRRKSEMWNKLKFTTKSVLLKRRKQLGAGFWAENTIEFSTKRVH